MIIAQMSISEQLDGKTIYNNVNLHWGGVDESLVLANEVKDINKTAYELAKHFTLLAKENGHFIEIGYYTKLAWARISSLLDICTQGYN
jgi:hypothetical protein